MGSFGAVAQLVERVVRNDEVACSTHVRSIGSQTQTPDQPGRAFVFLGLSSSTPDGLPLSRECSASGMGILPMSGKRDIFMLPCSPTWNRPPAPPADQPSPSAPRFSAAPPSPYKPLPANLPTPQHTTTPRSPPQNSPGRGAITLPGASAPGPASPTSSPLPPLYSLQFTRRGGPRYRLARRATPPFATSLRHRFNTTALKSLKN